MQPTTGLQTSKIRGGCFPGGHGALTLQLGDGGKNINEVYCRDHFIACMHIKEKYLKLKQKEKKNTAGLRFETKALLLTNQCPHHCGPCHLFSVQVKLGKHSLFEKFCPLSGNKRKA